MKTVATMIMSGRYKVMYDDRARLDPYRVYRFSGNRREMLGKYADMQSAIMKLADIAMKGSAER